MWVSGEKLSGPSFSEMKKVRFTVVCEGTGLKKGANGEMCQQDFEDSVTRVVLVGRLDIASNDMGPRYFI